MAGIPCDVDGQLYKGKTRHVYVSLLTRPEAIRQRFRVCPAHLVDLLGSPDSPWRYVNIDSATYSDADYCVVCLDPALLDPLLCFATSYPDDEREDYYGVCHPACAAAIGDGQLMSTLWHLRGG